MITIKPRDIIHFPVEVEQIKDDCFSYFLDVFHEAGCRKIFSEICANALLTYGIRIKNINYDTTSFIMWGNYETTEGTIGVITVDFGHSKARRPDKKQLKMNFITRMPDNINEAKALNLPRVYCLSISRPHWRPST